MQEKIITLKNVVIYYARVVINRIKTIIHAINQAKRKSNDNTTAEHNEVLQAIHPTIIWGMIITAVVLVFFGLWAGLAPLDSAAIANGSVVLSASRKTVQHLEGGIISEILVKDGDEVIAGQPLIHLNATSANSQQDLLLGQFRAAKAAEIRLLAERGDVPQPNFDHPLLRDSENATVQELVESQKKLFLTRKAAVIGQVDVLQERIMQYNEQIKGLDSQITEVKKQNSLIAQEVKSVSGLVAKGLEQKTRLLALQRRESELDGEQARHFSEIATIKGSISESQLQIINVQNEYLKDVMTQLKDVQQQVSDLQEKIQASGDILKRTVITAPQSGKITGLKYHTIGGVITPGAPLMDIVPQDDKLIVEAQVRPQDIDIVHDGLPAKVMLSAYKSRFAPRLEGRVTQVSADRFTNDKTGEAFFLARIEINEGALARLSKHIILYPGMPAEAFITTGESTFLQYIASPIIDSFRRSFKED